MSKRSKKMSKGSKGKGFVEGEGEFNFPNEDNYKGHYCAHVSGLAWRQGHGVYTTHEGQIYEGEWKDDKLDERKNVEIIFETEDKYLGRISKYKYNGPGTYWMKNGGRLTSNFSRNKPKEEVIYIDHFDKLWYGTAGEEQVLLKREHAFSQELDPDRGKGLPIHPPPEEVLEIHELEGEYEEEPTMEALERLVFAKSTKTKSDIDFEDSDWYRDFQDFKATYEEVIAKVATEGASSLSDLQKDWYRKFLRSMRQFENRKKLKKLDFHQLKGYLQERMKDTCPPEKVFYPTLAQ